ncbi:hypothetical protein ECC02_008714 [Trypanosoma cruzi]|uniref:Mucin TcMUCII n=1 Tax=Trypanosoma cruzi TaxID=5693 RepID=A0A7J6XVL3_TRYCR|nr:hypothetical protein ECC02_008714 [Trypanosoma cruzi]
MWCPLRNREKLTEIWEVRAVRKRNQMVRPIIHRNMIMTIRQGHKVAQISPQIKHIRTPKILPRRQRRRPPQHRHQPRPRPPLRRRHQVRRLQRRQLRRPPAHRHVCAKSTAASAALRGCVPRCCSPHPRWRTPLWAEEVYAGCACQHSTTGICVRVLWSDVNKVRVVMMIVFCFICFSCAAVCSTFLTPVSVTWHASQTHSYARHAYNCLRGITFVDGCMHTAVILCSSFLCVFNFFYFIAVCLPVFCF